LIWNASLLIVTSYSIRCYPIDPCSIAHILYGTRISYDSHGFFATVLSAFASCKPTIFHCYFLSDQKVTGLVLAACRSITRFAKPLKTHSSSLLTVASSSSNTTRFATPNELAVAAQLAKNVDGRCGGPDPQKGFALLWFALSSHTQGAFPHP